MDNVIYVDFKKKNSGGDKKPDPKINHRAIEVIEALLERLRSGESVAVAYVDVSAKDEIVSTFFWINGKYHHLCSGAARLAVDLAKEQV